MSILASIFILRAKLLRKSGWAARRGYGTRWQGTKGPVKVPEPLALPSFPLDPAWKKAFLAGEIVIFGQHWAPLYQQPVGISIPDFSFFGEAPLPDWHKDFLHNYRWPLETSTGLHLGQGVADIKVPWELARFQKWPALAKKISDSANEAEKFRERFAQEFLHFLHQNPYYQGIHWWNAMEVGIRAWNIACTVEIHPHFSPSFLAFVKEFLIKSSEYIWDNLEWYRKGRANHYLVNLCALSYLSRWIPYSNARKKFLACELEKEILRQFQYDGSCFEGSTYYHRFSLEAAALAWEASKNQLSWEKKSEVEGRLARALSFLLVSARSDGTLEQMGDNDSGRILKFYSCTKDVKENSRSITESLEVLKGILPSASYEKALPRQDFPQVLPPLKDSKEYTFSLRGSGTWQSNFFSEIGLYIWQREGEQILFYCGRKTKELKGAHAHFDSLHLSLWQKGEEAIADAGSYVYNNDLQRRRFDRSAQAHFIPQLEKEDWGFPTGTEPFLFEMLPDAFLEFFSDKGASGFYWHEGRLFRREICIEEKMLKVRDGLYAQEGRLRDLESFREKQKRSWAYQEEHFHG